MTPVLPNSGGPARDVVSLSSATHTTLALLRLGEPGEVVDAAELGLDHIRLNVLMRKGLAEYVGPGKWRATARGRRVAVRVPL